MRLQKLLQIHVYINFVVLTLFFFVQQIGKNDLYFFLIKGITISIFFLYQIEKNV